MTTPDDDLRQAAADEYPELADPRLAKARARSEPRMPEDLPAPDAGAAENRAARVRSDAERIAELERQIALLLAANKVPYPHGVMADGTEVPDAEHPYLHPRRYPVTLLLATGEQVGAGNFQSSHHYSRRLGRDVPVEGYLANEPAAA
jgi:hypothetical protein